MKIPPNLFAKIKLLKENEHLSLYLVVRPHIWNSVRFPLIEIGDCAWVKDDEPFIEDEIFKASCLLVEDKDHRCVEYPDYFKYLVMHNKIDYEDNTFNLNKIIEFKVDE